MTTIRNRNIETVVGLTAGAPYPGVMGGTYRLTRFGRSAATMKIELYEVTPDGRETFRGYVSAASWYRQVVCTTCGAPAGHACASLGQLSASGRPMSGVHSVRRRAVDAVPRH